MAVAACWECHVGEKLLGASAEAIALREELSADRPYWRCEATRSGKVLLVGLSEKAIAL